MPPKKKKSSRYSWIPLQKEEGLLCLPSWKEPTSINYFEGGYILNKVLYATVYSERDHVVPDSSITDKGQTVYIHPDTMKQCGVMINQPVLIMNTSNKILTVSNCWPAKSLDLHRIVLNSHLSSRLQFNKESDCIMCIEALPCNPSALPVIKEMNLGLKPDDKLLTVSDTFKHYLVFSQEGIVISEGSPISLTFHGKEHVFVVQSLILSNNHTNIEASKRGVVNNGEKGVGCDKGGVASNDIIIKDDSDITCNSTTSLINNLSSLSFSTPHKEHNGTSLSLLINDSSTSSPFSSTPSSHQLVNYDDSICDTPPLPSFPIPSHFVHSLDFGKVTLSTKVTFKTRIDKKDSVMTTPTLADIGGMGGVIRTLHELLVIPFLYPSLIMQRGVVFPKGILLHGPPGTGKSTLIHAIVKQANVPFKIINSTDVIINSNSSFLQTIFTEAREEAPCIIIVNDIHRICCHRNEGSSQFEFLSSFVKHFEEVSKRVSYMPHVVVVATTNDLSLVHVDLRRPGKFETEVEVHVPVAEEREEILKVFLKGLSHNLSDEEIKDIAISSHGHVGSDLKAVCLKAQQLLLRHHIEAKDWEEGPITINYPVMKRALQMIQPTAMKEITVEVPRVLWSDIGGEEDIKKELREATEWPINHPEALQRMGLDPPRGVLLYGPPGCSKTMIVRALATESGFNFLSIKGPEIFTKWVGDSEKAIRQVFSRARAAAPSIIFFDEMDSIATHRQGGNEGGSKVGDRVLTQLLTEIDGVEHLKGVLIVAATNRPDIIDKALLRSGRIDKKIYVPLPCAETRRAIFQIRFQKTPVHDEVNIEELVQRTDNYSGAEVVAVIQRAAQLALSQDINTQHVLWSHFECALNDIKPSTDVQTLKYYEEFGMTSK